VSSANPRLLPVRLRIVPSGPVADFDRYLAPGNVDPVRDGVGLAVETR
jgi:hypothetical protein